MRKRKGWVKARRTIWESERYEVCHQIGWPYFSLFSNKLVSLTLEGMNARNSARTHTHTRAPHIHTHGDGREATLSKGSLHIKLKIRGPKEKPKFLASRAAKCLYPANKISTLCSWEQWPRPLTRKPLKDWVLRQFKAYSPQCSSPPLATPLPHESSHPFEVSFPWIQNLHPSLLLGYL